MNAKTKCAALAAVVCGILAGAAGALAQGGEAPSPAVQPPTLDLSEPTTEDIDRILDRLDDLYRSKSSIAEVTLTVTKPRRKRTLTMKTWSLGKEKALIAIRSPAREKGIATLKVEKNLWNYMPRTSRTIRIPPSMMLGSWMGSDFTNDDLVRESSLRKDFYSRLIGRSEDPAGWRIELKAKEGTVGLWDRIEYILNPSATLPLQAKYYDRKGRLARVMDFTDVKQFGERKVPSRLVLTPIAKNGKPEKGRTTELLYKDIRFDVHVPESTFSLSRLERKR
jgi:outer membrane lipoprotein-sorting protein